MGSYLDPERVCLLIGKQISDIPFSYLKLRDRVECLGVEGAITKLVYSTSDVWNKTYNITVKWDTGNTNTHVHRTMVSIKYLGQLLKQAEFNFYE